MALAQLCRLCFVFGFWFFFFATPGRGPRSAPLPQASLSTSDSLVSTLSVGAFSEARRKVVARPCLNMKVLDNCRGGVTVTPRYCI